MAAGWGFHFAATFHELADRMRRQPHKLGEGLYHLQGGQIVHHVVRGPISLFFAIYESQSLVWAFRIVGCPVEER
jgi:hypothetical protein